MDGLMYLNQSNDNKISDNYFKCEYCSETFQSRTARTNHTLNHFKSKSCLNCKKILICINSDWYELHASIECNKENNVNNENHEINAINLENILDVKLEEEPDYPIGVPSVQSAIDDYDGNDTKDDILFGEQDDSQYQIEVRPLPEIKVRIKSEPTRSRRSTPKNPKTPAIFHIVKGEANISTINKDETKAKKNRKKVDKVTFLDHRPKSTCICDICKKTLGTFSSLRNHIINQHCINERVQRVTCDECGQTFSTPGNLNSHKKIHLKCKAYVCTYCGRGFNQLHNLKEHTNRHTGEKPYKCERCGKTFGRKTNLTAHTRVHTGLKPFKCNIEGCDRAYMFEIDLKRHKYSIHGIFTKKHICPICSKVYPENKLLKKHLESHSTGFS